MRDKINKSKVLSLESVWRSRIPKSRTTLYPSTENEVQPIAVVEEDAIKPHGIDSQNEKLEIYLVHNNVVGEESYDGERGLSLISEIIGIK